MSRVYHPPEESPDPDSDGYFVEHVLYAFTCAVRDLAGLGYNLDDLAKIAAETLAPPTDPEPYTGPDPFDPPPPHAPSAKAA